jgi:hypothetical protein
MQEKLNKHFCLLANSNVYKSDCITGNTHWIEIGHTYILICT